MRLWFLFLTVLTSMNCLSTDVIRSYEILDNDKNVDKIAQEFEIAHRNGKKLEVYVLENKAKYFESLSQDAKLLSKDIHQNFSEKALNGYKTFGDVENILKGMTQRYSSILTLETYGISKNNKNLYALKVNTPANNGKKQEVLITAATHGDELITVEILLKLMDEVISKYGQDSRITKMLDDKIFYFIPVVSPDSFESRSRYVENLDPNRSYPWPENVKNSPVSIIEALITFFHKHDFKATLDIHAHGRLVMYPWGYTKIAPSSSEDVSIMNDIVSSMAKENNYTNGQISTTIYVAKGSSADYYYWKNKTKAIAVEIGDQKVPTFSSIPKYLNESREMIYKFMEYQY